MPAPFISDRDPASAARTASKHLTERKDPTMSRTTRKQLSVRVLGMGLALAAFSGQAFAQATGAGSSTDAGTTAGSSTGAGTTAGSSTSAGTDTRTTHDDSGFNPGWLGLIGLAGLAGLMPKKNHVVTTTTHRPGDATTR